MAIQVVPKSLWKSLGFKSAKDYNNTLDNFYERYPSMKSRKGKGW